MKRAVFFAKIYIEKELEFYNNYLYFQNISEISLKNVTILYTNKHNKKLLEVTSMMKFPSLDQLEINSFTAGKNFSSYDFMGAHRAKQNQQTGIDFTLWAPFVKSVQVIGDFNNWEGSAHYMEHIHEGIWCINIPEATQGSMYKYRITLEDGRVFDKSDPYGFYSEQRPNTASIVYFDDEYKWNDSKWMAKRKKSDHFKKPLNIYEVHLGSWKQHGGGNESTETAIEDFYSYKQLAETLLPYVVEMGYTHIELMPLTEHPFDGSWGYQATGYFSPTSRYGRPEDLMYFIDCCHNKGIGIILDWVPGHFCPDAHGLANFNGDKLYEIEKHVEWGTYKFDFGRGQVRSFLFSSANYWFSKYHIDGIRIDGVTSMVYLNYGLDNKDNPKVNSKGGLEDLEALSFLSELNEYLAINYPGVMSIAEESTSLPLVTTPPYDGGLGFHYKWDMGWMNDTLEYMSLDFPFRPYEHNLLTFSTMYAHSENFIMPLSHDEVVHGKKSLIGRMPGDYWKQFANLRLLHLYQLTHTGAKLNFMGNEIGQYIEWRYYQGIEWFLLEYDNHLSYQTYVKEANNFFLKEKSLWQQNYSPEGFRWIDADNNNQGVLSYLRQGTKEDDYTIVVLNFQTHSYENFRVGVSTNSKFREVFNSDQPIYGGSGKLNEKVIKSSEVPMHGEKYSIEITVPPMGGAIFKPVKTRIKST